MSDPYARFGTDPLSPRELREVRRLLQAQQDRDAYMRGGERLKTISIYVGAALAIIGFINMLAPGLLSRLAGGG